MTIIKEKIQKLISLVKSKLNEFNKTKFIEKVKTFFSKGDRKFVLQLYLIALGVFVVTLITK